MEVAEQQDFRPTSLLAAVMQQQQYGSTTAARRRDKQKLQAVQSQQSQQQQQGETKSSSGSTTPSAKRQKTVQATTTADRGFTSAEAVTKELERVHGGQVTIRYRMRELLLYVVHALKTNGSTVELRFTKWGLTTERINHLDSDEAKYQVCTTAKLHSSWFDHYECEGTVNAVVKLGNLATILTTFKRQLRAQYIEITADNNSMQVKGAVSADDAARGNRFGLEVAYVQDAKQRFSGQFLPVTQYAYTVECFSSSLLAYLNAFASIMEVPDSQPVLLEIRLYLNPQRLFLNVASKTGAVRFFGIELTSAQRPGSAPSVTAGAAASDDAAAPPPVSPVGAVAVDGPPTTVEQSGHSHAEDRAVVTVSTTTTTTTTTPIISTKARAVFGQPASSGARSAALEGRSVVSVDGQLGAVQQKAANIRGARGRTPRRRGGRRSGRLPRGSAAAQRTEVLPDEGAPAPPPVGEDEDRKGAQEQHATLAEDEPVPVPALLPIASVIRLSQEEQAAMGGYVDVVVDQRDMLQAMSYPKMNTFCSLYFRQGQALAIRFVVSDDSASSDASKLSVVDAYVPLRDVRASDALAAFDQHVSSVM